MRQLPLKEIQRVIMPSLMRALILKTNGKPLTRKRERKRTKHGERRSMKHSPTPMMTRKIPRQQTKVLPC